MEMKCNSYSALQSLQIRDETETPPPRPPLLPPRPPSSCSPGSPYYNPCVPYPSSTTSSYYQPVKNRLYDKHFLGNVTYMDYFCTTSGPDHGGVKFQGSVRTARVDYVHNIVISKYGFTVNGGPLKRFDDPTNHSFLDAIKNTEFPKELVPTDKDTKVHQICVTKEQKYRNQKENLFDAIFKSPPSEISWFEPGTSQEILDAAADPPNSYVIPLCCERTGTSYMLFKPPPKSCGLEIQI